MNTIKGVIPPFLLVIFAIIAVLSALAGAGWATAIAGSFTSLLIAVAVLFGLSLVVKHYFPNGKDRR